MLGAYYASQWRLSNCALRQEAWSKPPLRSWVSMCLLCTVLLNLSGLAVQAQVAVGTFSGATPGAGLPESWEALLFPKIQRHTTYRLLSDEATVVLQAKSDGAAAGLRRAVALDPQVYPILHWRWKVTEAPRSSDVRRKAQDDAPARLYVAFAYDETKVSWLERAEFELGRSLYGEYPPWATVMYVWERQLPVGTLVTSPYTKRVKMFVLRNSRDETGTWYSETRNVYEDYQRAFGGIPPMIVGVALMTDTDNTGEKATAYYGDIVFQPSAR